MSTPCRCLKRLVGGEEEGPSAPDRAAERSAELVLRERVRIRRGELEEVARVERVVPPVLEDLAVKLVGARSGDDVDDRPGHVTVLGTERRVVDLELLDAPERRLEDERAERQVVGRHAVDDERDSLFAVAGGVDGDRADSTNRSGGEPGLRRRHRPRHEQAEIGEVATVQRNLLHRLRRDDVADGGRGAIDERDFGVDDDRFALWANCQAEVAHHGASDVDDQFLDDLGAKTGRVHR